MYASLVGVKIGNQQYESKTIEKMIENLNIEELQIQYGLEEMIQEIPSLKKDIEDFPSILEQEIPFVKLFVNYFLLIIFIILVEESGIVKYFKRIWIQPVGNFNSVV